MENGKKSKKKKIIIFSLIVVILGGLGTLVLLGSKRETVVTVQTEKIKKRDIVQIVSASGKIQPEIQVKINAEVSGEIIELPVREGQRVRKGQLLVRIKPDAYQAQVDRAEAQLSMAKANLMKAEAEFKRVSELYEKRLVSQAEMDIAKASYESAKATYNQSQAGLREARETLSKTSIYSPMDGVVSQLLSEIGERVSGSTFMQGTQMMTIADLSRMEARVDVGENDIVNVTIGDTARISVDAFPDRKFVGIVSQIANTAKTRGLGTQEEVTNFEVRILLNQPDGVMFRPGMSMTADIETERKAGVLAVPIQSVTAREKKETGKPEEQPQEGEARLASAQNTGKKKEEEKIREFIFVVKDGVIVEKEVKRGISDESYVEVTGNVEEESEVVSGPFRAINRDLKEGTKVKVENEKKGPAAQGR